MTRKAIRCLGRLALSAQRMTILDNFQCAQEMTEDYYYCKAMQLFRHFLRALRTEQWLTNLEKILIKQCTVFMPTQVKNQN